MNDATASLFLPFAEMFRPKTDFTKVKTHRPKREAQMFTIAPMHPSARSALSLSTDIVSATRHVEMCH
jgi:hypothetical protein